MRDFIDKTPVSSGTKINRSAMMAVQGFDNLTTVFVSDNQIKQTNDLGETRTITFHKDGRIVEKFEGQKTIPKTTAWGAGKITEVLS